MTDIRSADGVTLLELIIAVFISAIVASLAFMTYSTITSTFYRQNRYADMVSNMVLVKKRIDAAFSDIELIQRSTEHELHTVCSGNEDEIPIIVRGNALIKGTDTIAVPFESFSFQIHERNSAQTGKRVVVMWEGILLPKKNWIGGSFTASK